MSKLALFVTGTDTGVGKTLVSAALMRRCRAAGRTVAGMKPVASGSRAGPDGLRNDDALLLQAEATRHWPYAVVNPFAYAPPIAPHLAAEEAGVPIDFDVIRTSFDAMARESDVIVVEGAGGWLVPVGPRRTFADLAGALGLEVVLVVGLRLGCVNHALLTAEAIAARGLRLRGWIGSGIDPAYERLAANVATLDARLPAPCLGLVPPLAPPDVGRAAAALALQPLGL